MTSQCLSLSFAHFDCHLFLLIAFFFCIYNGSQMTPSTTNENNNEPGKKKEALERNIMSAKRNLKISALVVNALRRLQDVQGSTAKEISNYIAQEYDVHSTDIRRQVQLALRRGLSYGILQRTKGGYYICSGVNPTNEKNEVQDENLYDEIFGKNRGVKSRSACFPRGRRGGRSKSRSSKRGKCSCKSARGRSKRKKSKRGRGKHRSCGSRSRSRKSRRGKSKKKMRMCRSSKKKKRRGKSRKKRRSRSRGMRSCPRPKKPRKCMDMEPKSNENVNNTNPEAKPMNRNENESPNNSISDDYNSRNMDSPRRDSSPERHFEEDIDD